MKILDRILKGNLCLGCGLCAALAPDVITLQNDASGFLRPLQSGELSRESEELIALCCPGIQLHPQGNDAKRDPLWGRIVQARVGFATDPTTRFLGASGGAISGLLAFLLKSSFVDYVIHVGVSQENPLLNAVYISKTADDVLRLAGSRYAPSAPLVDILQLLEKEGGRAAFVGKPCDVAALRQLGSIDSIVREHVVYYLSFFCAGVPSLHGTTQILDSFGISATDVEEFQYRGRGWPGNTKAKCKDGRCFEMDYATSWGTILNRHLQFRCKICPDGIGEFADISCADAWYSEDGYPDFKEKEGRSLIITRTKLGEDLVNQAISSHAIEADGVSVADIAKMQPYQVYRKQGIFPRLLAMRLLGRETPVFRGLGLFVSSTRGGALSFLKHFAGMGLRLLKKTNR